MCSTTAKELLHATCLCSQHTCTPSLPCPCPLPTTRSVLLFAAAKSLQSCPTLRDPIDGSPPGFLVLGILLARTLELLFNKGYTNTIIQYITF